MRLAHTMQVRCWPMMVSCGVAIMHNQLWLPIFFCGVLADSGVDCIIPSMQCRMLLQPPLFDEKLTDYNTFIAGWEVDAYEDFLRGCCVVMPGINAIRLRVALMQSMGVKCRLAHMVHWMNSKPGLCTVAHQKKKKPIARKLFVKKDGKRVYGTNSIWE